MAPTRDRSSVDDDPLWLAIKPPKNETPEQQAIRLKREAEARRISDQIDEAIRAESAQMKKRKIIRLLLLGQSESGKSTTIKQFQLLHSPNAFHTERLSWRLVIQLNLVKSIRRILEAVLTTPLPSTSVSPPPIPYSDDRWDTDASGVAYPIMRASMESDWTGTTATSSGEQDEFTELKQRLLPLLHAEEILIQKLAAPDSVDYRGDALGGRQGFNHLSWTDWENGKPEMFVRSGDWKTKTASTSSAQEEVEDEPTRIIYQCREDMISLWRNPVVHQVLRQKMINLSESSGFFLNDMERITARDYLPSNHDILNARLKTVGVVEHSFTIGEGGKGADWRIYDVGGSRSQRATWAPFFDNVQAIIFLAPVSAFDQVLAEDPSVNRLEDSLLLWKELVKNVILSKVPLVLFLNKCDLLKRKLNGGVRLSRYMISYGERPNDYESIVRYFKSKFDAIRRQYSKEPEREFYVYSTSVTDTRQTAAIIASVRDMILRDNLRTSHLM
ncbi:hypothetical protein FRC02_001010 [Tulasnella sp. 418]|nr:hypothetical protein FRC02_001010 [Tulasnella sp. 418]